MIGVPLKIILEQIFARHEKVRDSSKMLQEEMSRAEVDGSKAVVTMHVVASLDGFIAKKDNSVSWMDTPEDT